MIDRYKHLNKPNEIGLNVSIEDVAEHLMTMNYGAQRMCSAMVRKLRERDKDSKMADVLEEMLNNNIYY